MSELATKFKLGNHFSLTTTGLVVRGTPGFEEYAGVGLALQHFMVAVPYALGDWMNYGEERRKKSPEWGEKLDQAMAGTGQARHTLMNASYVCRAVSPDVRRESPSPTHTAEVAPLEAPDQRRWLIKASTEGWTVRELRQNLRAARRERVIAGQAELKGRHRVLLVDPPWKYGNSGVIKGSKYGRAEAHYEGMGIEELCRIPVAAHTRKNAIMFMYVTSPFLMLNPGPREIIEAWGFEYKTSFVWDKVLGQFGHYNHVVHEFILVCTRGSCLPDVPTPQPKSIIHERRTPRMEHSEKPESFRKLIETHWTKGPYLELFGRKPVEGWTVFGNDARLWPEGNI